MREFFDILGKTKLYLTSTEVHYIIKKFIKIKIYGGSPPVGYVTQLVRVFRS